MEHDLVAEWFRYAETDLTAAEYLLGHRPQPMAIVCYLCQQSAEKHLKGYLTYRGVNAPPRTHNLNTLFEMCLELDPGFLGIERACDVLTRRCNSDCERRVPHAG